MKIIGNTPNGDFIVRLSLDELEIIKAKGIQEDWQVKAKSYQQTEIYKKLIPRLPKGTSYYGIARAYMEDEIDGSLISGWEIDTRRPGVGPKTIEKIQKILLKLNIPKPSA